MIDVCILWGWCLHVFWSMPCHLSSGVVHVFLWSLWWLVQACKVGPVIFLISGTDFSKSLSAVILLSCKLDATERSMHILRYFSKDVLNIWLLSIHSCPWLQLWSSLACHFRALLLLQNVSWQIVYMLFNFAEVVAVDPCMLWCCFLPCIASMTCLLDGCMLSLSWDAL